MFCSADSAELVSSDSAEPAGDEEVESADSLSGRKSTGTPSLVRNAWGMKKITY